LTAGTDCDPPKAQIESRFHQAVGVAFSAPRACIAQNVEMEVGYGIGSTICDKNGSGTSTGKEASV
jgi:hypothetical protein